jgi:hypothetical protein
VAAPSSSTSSTSSSSTSLKELVQQLQQAAKQMDDIPKLIEAGKWDSVRVTFD